MSRKKGRLNLFDVLVAAFEQKRNTGQGQSSALGIALRNGKATTIRRGGCSGGSAVAVKCGKKTTAKSSDRIALL